MDKDEQREFDAYIRGENWGAVPDSFTDVEGAGLQIKLTEDADIPVLKLRGKVDLHTTHLLNRTFRTLARSGRYQVIVDCQDLEQLDVAGLGVMVEAVRHLRIRHGGIYLAQPNQFVRNSLRMTRLNKVLPIADTIEAAKIMARTA